MDISVVDEELDGRTVVVKRARTVSDVERLVAEAQWLGTIAHPGVVELVDFASEDVDGAQVVELTTAFAGSVTLADLSPAGAGSGAAVVAAVAAIVADLHAGGVAHGALSRDHVIVGKTGQPILCSFGAASEATAETIRADVEAMAELLAEVVRRSESGTARTPRRQARALRAVVAWCGSPDASATALATRLVAIPGVALAPSGGEAKPDAADDTNPQPAPVAVAPTRPGSEVAPTRTWRDRVVPERKAVGTRKAPYVPVAAILVTLLGLFGFQVRGQDDPVAALPTSPARSVPGGGATLVQTLPPAPGIPPSPCEGAPDGQPGCTDKAVVIGNLINVGDNWYVAGLTGDQVVVGDWDCDGLSTPALLRPDTGEVFVFSAWPSPGGEIDTLLAALVTDQVKLVAERSADCDVLNSLGSAPSDGPTPVERP